MPTLLRAPTRPYKIAVMDHARWEKLTVRDDDIVIATSAKCGTTWMQRIVDLLVFQDTSTRLLWKMSPWLDSEIFGSIEEMVDTLNAQTHRRFIKSHLPFDSLPLYDSVKYIHVVRDGRDAGISMHNHVTGTRPEHFAKVMENNPLAPVFPDIPPDQREFFLLGLALAEQGTAVGGGLPFFEFEMTYWRERQRENLLFVHYNDLKADLPGEMARVSAFLGINTPAEILPLLAQAASFEAMKRQGDEMIPELMEGFDRGADRFINKGTNGRWRDVLTADDIARYEKLARERLTPGAARWIEHGTRVAGDPRTLVD